MDESSTTYLWCADEPTASAGPDREPDRQRDKRQALKLAAHAAEKAELAERQKRAAIRVALERGATHLEVEEATGVPRKTAERLAQLRDDDLAAG